MIRVFLVREGEFVDEVCQPLCLNGRSGVEFNVELAEFDGPLNHSSSRFGFVHGFSDGLVRPHQDGTCLEILP